MQLPSKQIAHSTQLLQSAFSVVSPDQTSQGPNLVIPAAQLSDLQNSITNLSKNVTELSKKCDDMAKIEKRVTSLEVDSNAMLEHVDVLGRAHNVLANSAALTSEVGTEIV